MPHLFAMADERQPREHRLHEHPVFPRAPRTPCEVGGIACRRREAGVTQDAHPPIHLLHEPWKGVVRDSGRGTGPPPDHPPLLEQQTEFAADNPAVIREAFPAELLRAAAFTPRMEP